MLALLFTLEYFTIGFFTNNTLLLLISSYFDFHFIIFIILRYILNYINFLLAPITIFRSSNATFILDIITIIIMKAYLFLFKITITIFNKIHLFYRERIINFTHYVKPIFFEFN